MPVTLDQNGQSLLLRLEGDIDISIARELKLRLLDALAALREVRIEFAAAASLDITGLQLLWAAKRAAGQAGVSFRIQGRIPDQIVNAATRAGLHGLLVSA